MKGSAQKVKKLPEIIRIAAAARKTGNVVVTTNGCFDILHVGHIRNLEAAKSLGDILIVGVNSDKSVRENKGAGRPIVSEKERAEVIAALACVDYVFIFGTKTPIEWIEKVKPAIHAKGADRVMSQIVEKEAVEKNDGKIVLIRYHKGKSSTAIIEKSKKAKNS
jgi:rfaE bifunctional protein nucleotidyltransferase chain/domain